jgi:hypothetical protein
MFAALLDTSVLWPSLQRDFLLSLAVEGCIGRCGQQRSSMNCATTKRRSSSVAAQRAQRLVDRMSTAFNDAIVVNWESLDGTFGLPDVDDEHVVAAALVGGADVIVTSNLKDFPPQQILKPLTVSSPMQFAADTVAVSPTSPIAQ